MHLIITLRRDVTDEDQAELLFAIVNQKLQDHPEITITGQVSQILELEAPPT